MPIRINDTNTSIHKLFWNAVTNNGSDSLALSQLWLCGINTDKFKVVQNQLNQIDMYEEGAWNRGFYQTSQFDINNAVMHGENWTSVSPAAGAPGIYMWTRGVNFIGDGFNASRVGVSQSGAIKGLVGDGRTDLSTSNITFLESNISFVDGILRPWSVLVGYRSLKDIRLRCDIEFFCLQKWSLNEPLHIRKSMLLKNAAPLNIDAEEYNYTGDKLIERQVQFVFDRYEMRVYSDVPNEEDSPINIPFEYGFESQQYFDPLISNGGGGNQSDIIDSPIITIDNINPPEANTEGNISWEELRDLPNYSPIFFIDIRRLRRERLHIHSNQHRYRVDHYAILSDINPNLTDSVLLDTFLNPSLIDHPVITPAINVNDIDASNINYNLQNNQENKNTDVKYTQNINSENTSNNIEINQLPVITDEETSIEININDDYTDSVESPTYHKNINKINSEPTLIYNKKVDIGDTTPEIQWTRGEQVTDETSIEININDDYTDSVESPTYHKNINKINSEPTLIYNKKVDIGDTTPEIQWTRGEQVTDETSIIYDIHSYQEDSREVPTIIPGNKPIDKS
ncbi:MAG: hypothetical protein PHS54_00570 [Clostridia bacterium]|nr:hypothetical protein [Clostridia bacterium]